MESNIGTAVQFAGVFLTAALLLFLRRSMRSATATYWLAAWVSLSVSFLAIATHDLYPSRYFLAPRHFAEYLFGLLMLTGCASLDGTRNFNFRTAIWIVPLFILAVALSDTELSATYAASAHSFVLGIFFAACFVELWGSTEKTFGRWVVQFSVGVAAADYFIRSAQLPAMSVAEPLITIALELILGFGTIVVLIEQIFNEVRAANQKIEDANEKLRRIAHIDPLTTAFNRHAFYGFLKRGESEKVSGCVGFFDIDELKPINDQYGHPIGDLVIRAVVGAIRNVIRAEDLIYRWGGDEFFVIMVSMDEEMAFERMKNVDRMLADLKFDGVKQPLTVSVSYGFKNFEDLSNLEEAVTAADQEMYRRKKERKFRREFVAQTEESVQMYPATN